jgi:hypothetical protein
MRIRCLCRGDLSELCKPIGIIRLRLPVEADRIAIGQNFNASVDVIVIDARK